MNTIEVKQFVKEAKLAQNWVKENLYNGVYDGSIVLLKGDQVVRVLSSALQVVEQDYRDYFVCHFLNGNGMCDDSIRSFEHNHKYWSGNYANKTLVDVCDSTSQKIGRLYPCPLQMNGCSQEVNECQVI